MDIAPRAAWCRGGDDAAAAVPMSAGDCCFLYHHDGQRQPSLTVYIYVDFAYSIPSFFNVNAPPMLGAHAAVRCFDPPQNAVHCDMFCVLRRPPLFVLHFVCNLHLIPLRFGTRPP